MSVHLRPFLVAGVAALLATAALASDASDPAGDFDTKRGEPYQDIVHTEITKQAGRLICHMTLAASLPPDEAPAPVKGGQGANYWEWGINTSPEVPLGDPLPGNQGLDLEYMVMFTSDGTRYFAQLWDRTHLLEGGEVKVTDLEWHICGDDRKTIEVVVGAELLGDPAEFTWRSGSILHETHLGTQGFKVIDFGTNGEMIAWSE